MGYLTIFALIGLCLMIKGDPSLNDLECYECTDCGSLDDSKLVSCSAGLIPTPPPTPPSTSSPQASDKTTTRTTKSTTITTGSPLMESTPIIISSSSAETEEVETDHPVTTESVTDEPVTDQLENNLKQSHHRSQTKRNAPGAYVSFYCYSYDKYENGAWKTNKGCVYVHGSDNRTGCEILSVAEEHCMACTEDRCNKSSVIRFSFVTVLVALVMAFGLQ